MIELTRADRVEINKLRRAYKKGSKAFDGALDKLAKDPVRFYRVIEMLFPSFMQGLQQHIGRARN